MRAMDFFLYWLSFAGLILAAAAITIAWAFRKGHFRDQERARYLALWAGTPEEEKKNGKTTGSGSAGTHR